MPIQINSKVLLIHLVGCIAILFSIVVIWFVWHFEKAMNSEKVSLGHVDLSSGQYFIKSHLPEGETGSWMLHLYDNHSEKENDENSLSYQETVNTQIQVSIENKSKTEEFLLGITMPLTKISGTSAWLKPGDSQVVFEGRLSDFISVSEIEISGWRNGPKEVKDFEFEISFYPSLPIKRDFYLVATSKVSF